MKLFEDKEPGDSCSLLEIRDVVKSFGGIKALDHCTFRVRPGKITGLIGPNGAGKTSLFDLITGFLKVTSGSIWFSGQRIDGLTPHQIFHQGILRTFQIPRELKRMTVLENLMLVPSQQTGEKIWASWLLPWRIRREEQSIQKQALEVIDFLNLRPLTNEYAGNLSTGQKKLMELGRTLMAQPKIVLLDELGAGVNPSLMKLLVEDIRLSCQEKGITFLLIEHDMDLVMNLCDPIVVMSSGAIIAEGSPEEVKANQGVVDAYLGGTP